MHCIESVQKSSYPNVDIYLIDNGSTSVPTNDIREKYPQILYTRNLKNLGFTGGTNLGMQYACDHDYD